MQWNSESKYSRKLGFRYIWLSEIYYSGVSLPSSARIGPCFSRAFRIGLGWCTCPAAGEVAEGGAMSEENKALARRSWESVENPDSLEEVYTPDVVWHNPEGDIQGIEQAKQFVSMFKSAFPDMSATVEDVVAEGDKVVTRVTLRGTHQGEVEEFGPPTGRQVETQGITIHRIEGAKIVEEWERYDNLGMMQQLGLVAEQQ